MSLAYVPDSSVSHPRNIAMQHVYQNLKTKVGVLSSSERTHARVSEIRTTTHKNTPSDVVSALRRVRNLGNVAPKKKGASPISTSFIPTRVLTPITSGYNPYIVPYALNNVRNYGSIPSVK